MRWPSGSSRPVIGFIGLGRMGAPVAARVRRAGFELVVFDARTEATEPLVAMGAIAAETAPGAAASCDILVTLLPGPAQIEAVMAGSSGAFQALREGSAWVDMSTSSPALARAILLANADRRVAVLDAPVAGMVREVDEGTVQVFVGGSAAETARIRPLLEAVASPERIQHVGGRGSGYIVKLCLTLMWLIHAAASAEVLVLGAKAGVDSATLRRAVVDGPAGSSLLRRDIDGVFAGDYEESYPLELVTKDLALAVDLGRDAGVPVELASVVEQLHRRARALYGDAAGGLSAIRLAEETAGIRLRDPAP